MKTRNKKITDNQEESGGLEILPIRPIPINEKTNYNKILPSIARNSGSISLLLGATASGKTTIINNLLLQSKMWGAGGKGKKKKDFAFEKVYIFTPSIHMDDSCRFLRENFECYSEFNDDILQEILNKQEQFEKKDRPKIMIVIDDSVGMIHSNSTLTHFLSRYRHWNANVIISVQNFRSISVIGRSNATDVFMMNGIINAKELNKINEEWGGMVKDTLIPAYKKYASKPYSFLYIKLRKNPVEMYQNFGKKIDWKKMVKDDSGSDEESENEL